jgi:hypothetical protein
MCFAGKLRLDEREIRQANLSTSSNGEDLWMNDLFFGVVGHYLEIGCHHPRMHSLTYPLYSRGWSGICLDPNPDWAVEFARKRPRDFFWCGALVCRKEPHAYHQYENSQLNHLTLLADPPRPQGEGRLLASQTVRGICWDMILAQARDMGMTFDLLVIDAEWMSGPLFQEAPIPGPFHPRVVVVESADARETPLLENLLKKRGYTVLRRPYRYPGNLVAERMPTTA